MTPEGRVKKLCKEWYKIAKGWCFAPVSNGMGVHGIPDYVGCVPVEITPEMVGLRVGIFVCIEAKAPGRRGEPDRGCSPAQVFRMDEIRAAGGHVRVVDSLEDLAGLEDDIKATGAKLAAIALGKQT